MLLRFCCIWIPDFTCRAAARHIPTLPQKPVLVYAGTKVPAVSPQARIAGVHGTRLIGGAQATVLDVITLTQNAVLHAAKAGSDRLRQQRLVKGPITRTRVVRLIGSTRTQVVQTTLFSGERASSESSPRAVEYRLIRMLRRIAIRNSNIQRPHHGSNHRIKAAITTDSRLPALVLSP